MANRLAEVRKPIEQPEQKATSSTPPKKPTLADKLQAANEKVKAQDSHSNTKTNKREER